MLHTYFVDTPLAYSGSELSSHWIYRSFGLQGDALAIFAGPCEVKLSEMVDLADVQANAPIYSEHMLHIIIEHFQADLRSMILRQRLLTAQVKDLLEANGIRGIRRSGDDLYDGEHKLSVSIATVSPVSGLIHFGINISSQNTPVLTKGLNDYGLNWKSFAQSLAESYAEEEAGLQTALVKVRWVP